MGSYSALIKQCALLLVLVLLVGYLAPVGAKIWVLITGGIALVVFVVISIYRRRSILKLAHQIDEILYSPRNVDISTYHEGDIALLSNELAKMVSKLSRTNSLLDSEKQFLSKSLTDISHQIRTPLTAAVLTIPAIEKASDEFERKRLCHELEDMLERISWLVVTLMKIAKIDSGAINVKSDDVDVTQVVYKAIEPLALLLDIKNISLELDLQDGAHFVGDGAWTAEALENIVKNCMEHTPTGGKITINSTEDALATKIIVSDTGCGISKEDLPHVFERFYRGKRARSEDAKNPTGFGIGLSLSLALVSSQGGTIRASNGSNGGASFLIAFPKLVV